MKVVWWILQWPIGIAWALLAWTIRATSRVTVDGKPPDGAAVFVNWHRYNPFLLAFHGAHRRWTLVSPSPRLEPVARYCKLMGLRLVRGASGERGAQAREELKSLLLRGESVTIAVDGPAGPLYRAKKGCVEIATAASVPIVPIAYRCSFAHEFAWRWDRMLLPLPFGRIEIVYGHPIQIAAGDPDALATVEASLNEVSSLV